MILNSSVNIFTPPREHFATDLKAIRILTDYLFSRLRFLRVYSSHPGNSRGFTVISSSSPIQADTAVAFLVSKFTTISFQTAHQVLKHLSIPLSCHHCRCKAHRIWSGFIFFLPPFLFLPPVADQLHSPPMGLHHPTEQTIFRPRMGGRYMLSCWQLGIEQMSNT